ncbi:PaaI family thioesterase [Nocardioides sp.]|jgi:acyl-coenzyme A thioesterase PaaI-like protein|uniref:PaaI family thioesterase n=1 Tax=Nocardioides sp. TaxID=35761 RepID=UPI001D26C6BE|nr:PaaI family thioesterase [Nocardioides sp.]MBU1801634.1 PaaI family thioesterase [Actinomycetota bacterium]
MSGETFDALLAGWRHEKHLPQSEGGALPSHHAQCLGCGAENPHGHHLVVTRDGPNVVAASHTFDARHVGAPGIVHGGAVATVFDDLYGFLLYSVGDLAVTRKLDVEYLRPVLLDVDYTLRATIAERAGRKIHMAASLEDSTGLLAARSSALFVTVDIDHFKNHGRS